MKTPGYGPESSQCISTFAKRRRTLRIWLGNCSSRQTIFQLVDTLQLARKRTTLRASSCSSWNGRIVTWKSRSKKKTGWLKNWKRTSKWVNIESLTTKYKLTSMSAWGWGPCWNRQWFRTMLLPLSKIISQLLKMVSRKTKPDCRKRTSPKRPSSARHRKSRTTSRSQLWTRKKRRADSSRGLNSWKARPKSTTRQSTRRRGSTRSSVRRTSRLTTCKSSCPLQRARHRQRTRSIHRTKTWSLANARLSREFRTETERSRSWATGWAIWKESWEHWKHKLLHPSHHWALTQDQLQLRRRQLKYPAKNSNLLYLAKTTALKKNVLKAKKLRQISRRALRRSHHRSLPW